ncbi:DUF6691 family protein [Hyalangium minutum]|uniref:YeeE/YedE family protein n=1 Tax=Hyalangium minutum TaxID=394096 RepID=A0A085W2V0_9BACT|nr:DUF6691 family protein [Hyalangium minutum]KFE62013.1 hypothetical protein DB31_4456 [Hyalangium minutum]
MSALWTAGVAGLLFAFGLGLGGMTDPARVQGFLDVTGSWNPTLAFVMGGALAVHAPLSWLIRRRKTPVLAPAFPNVSHTQLDRRLLGGAALFGVGWGLSGYCPGPVLVSLAGGTGTVLLFVASMFAGMWLFGWWERSRATAPQPQGDLSSS